MNQREMVMAAATGAIVVSALGWTVGVRPLIDRWTAARDRREALQEQLEKSAQLVKRKDDLEAERRTIERNLAATDSLDPTFSRPDAIATFLDRLRELTDASGFKPRDLTFVRAEPLDAYAELRFSLRARAPLRQIQDFLVRMTASEWYLRVQALQVQPREGGEIEADMALVGLVSQDALDESEIPGKKKGR